MLRLNLKKRSDSALKALVLTELGSIIQKAAKLCMPGRSAFARSIRTQIKFVRNGMATAAPANANNFQKSIGRAFTEKIARRKLKSTQVPFLDRLRAALDR